MHTHIHIHICVYICRWTYTYTEKSKSINHLFIKNHEPPYLQLQSETTGFTFTFLYLLDSSPIVTNLAPVIPNILILLFNLILCNQSPTHVCHHLGPGLLIPLYQMNSQPRQRQKKTGNVDRVLGSCPLNTSAMLAESLVPPNIEAPILGPSSRPNITTKLIKSLAFVLLVILVISAEALTPAPLTVSANSSVMIKRKG